MYKNFLHNFLSSSACPKLIYDKRFIKGFSALGLIGKELGRYCSLSLDKYTVDKTSTSLTSVRYNKGLRSQENLCTQVGHLGSPRAEASMGSRVKNSVTGTDC